MDWIVSSLSKTFRRSLRSVFTSGTPASNDNPLRSAATEEFADGSRLIFDVSPLCASCANPCQDHIQYSTTVNAGINHRDQMEGTVKPYGRHFVVCAGTADLWPTKIDVPSPSPSPKPQHKRSPIMTDLLHPIAVAPPLFQDAGTRGTNRPSLQESVSGDGGQEAVVSFSTSQYTQLVAGLKRALDAITHWPQKHLPRDHYYPTPPPLPTTSATPKSSRGKQQKASPTIKRSSLEKNRSSTSQSSVDASKQSIVATQSHIVAPQSQHHTSPQERPAPNASMVTLCDRQSVHLDYADKKWTCDVLVFPQMLLFRSVTATSAQDLVASYVNLAGKGKAPQMMSVDSLAEFGIRNVVLVCGHKKRDARCGEAGPLLVEEFQRVLSRKRILGSDNLDPPAIKNDNNFDNIDNNLSSISQASTRIRDIPNNVLVYMTSHVGGHQFAGNVLIYPEGDWYGRVRTCHVQDIVQKHLIEGKIVKELWRGRTDFGFPKPTGDPLSW